MLQLDCIVRLTIIMNHLYSGTRSFARVLLNPYPANVENVVSS